MSSVPKVVRAAQKAVINQYMTREAVTKAAFQPTTQIPIQQQQPQNIRLHDESIHLKFGFPNLEKSVENQKL
ncbi:unnamed protein product [Caenorhabditis angaria]|uniref:Uncharacterized protein n=1 Tax=Caenorhabditis angaria TaxID=860376 RepID=A0A9P1J1Y4_9PELO|nr:unnamed protein product [Caenorhabditis angaria]